MRNSELSADLIGAIAAQFRLKFSSIHGPAHWMRVRQNGLMLAEHTGANIRVVELFAVFHDSCRESDGSDPMHGPRGAALAQDFWERGLFECSEKDLETLQVACFGHTVHRTHADITVATCWDADRLDLPRLGITPAPHKLCTQAAKNRNLIAEAAVRAERWRARAALYRIF